MLTIAFTFIAGFEMPIAIAIGISNPAINVNAIVNINNSNQKYLNLRNVSDFISLPD